MKTKTLTLLAALVITPFASPKAEAGAFIHFEGIENINPADPGRQDWITLDSVQFGAERRGTSKRALPSLMVKGLDAASPKLAELLNNRTVVPSVIIEIERDLGDGTNEAYLRYELTNVVVTSWKVEEGESLAGLQPVTLNYEEIKWTYQSLTVTHIPSGNTATINLD